ncbi:MAG: tetratricopeptide repeat protein [Bacteroidales bacterium]|jgi:tetratricopeptide (TPR) repeat protein|nr:tetratricopeptide repeat protein [Bacteroidales bacterium]
MNKKVLFALFVFLFNTILIKAQQIENDIQVCIIAGQYNKALELSEKLLIENPNDANLHYQQSIILKQLYRYPEAINSIEKALAIDPENITYLSEYAAILAKKDKDAQAFLIWNKILQKDSTNSNAGVIVANQYIKNKEFEKAYRIFQNLYESDTLNGFFARNLGFCSIKLLNSDNSIKWLEKAIKLDSTDIKAYEYLAIVYVSLKDHEHAIGILEKATKFEPENENLYIKMGDYYGRQNHNYRALTQFEKAYKINPENEYVLKSLGQYHFYIDEYIEAKHYLKMTELIVNDAEIFQYLGDIYMKLGSVDSSILYYNKALEMVKPDYVSILFINEKIGKAYYEVGDFQKSIDAFKSAIDIQVEDKLWMGSMQDKLIIDIASIYSDRLNDKKTAIEYYKKIKKAKVIVNKDYFQYAQDQITRLNEELFFEGKL